MITTVIFHDHLGNRCISIFKYYYQAQIFADSLGFRFIEIKINQN